MEEKDKNKEIIKQIKKLMSGRNNIIFKRDLQNIFDNIENGTDDKSPL
jgi:hypothetical protein